VEGADVVDGRPDRRDDRLVDRLDRAFGLCGDVEVPHLDAVELAGVLAERDVALLANAVEDLPHVVADGRDARVPLEERRPLGRRELGDLADGEVQLGADVGPRVR
jgi:hypothetical protein